MRLTLTAAVVLLAVPAPANAATAGRVIGNGTAASCTSEAVVTAVARGGVITFACGPQPVTIVMKATAKVRNTSACVVLDGGGKVTLSGGGKRRILYMNTCDKAQVWTTDHCADQAQPQLTVRGLTFADGNVADGEGGGAIFVRGGRLTVAGSRFVRNRCQPTGPDAGGAALRVLDQYRDLPVSVSKSTFTGGTCANGGALSSIGVSWDIRDSVFTGNRAIGRGANPPRSGTPGGGNGGALYFDGNRFTVRITGSLLRGNRANEGGGAMLFVSNDRTGTLTIDRSKLLDNPSLGFETKGYPGIFYLGSGKPRISHSTLR